MQQQQKQIDEAIEKAQNETVLKQAEENSIRLADFDAILQPIIDSCTKDSISAGMTSWWASSGMRDLNFSSSFICSQGKIGFYSMRVMHLNAMY